MLAVRRFSADFEVLRAHLLIWARLIDVAGVTQDMVGTINALVEVGGTIILASNGVIADADGIVLVVAGRAAIIAAQREGVTPEGV